MKKNFFYKIILYVTLECLLFLSASCVSVPSITNARTIKTDRGEILEYRLSNGIPVYIKPKTDGQMDAVYLVVKGGVAELAPDKSGLENALFTMLTKGYEDGPDMDTLLYSTKASLTSSTMKSGSFICLTCIDYNLDKLLPVMTESFMHPRYLSISYQNIYRTCQQQIQTAQNNPGSMLSYEIEKSLYEGQPYQTTVNATQDSLSNITVDNMKALHKQIMNAHRISVVAVGCMDVPAFLDRLEKSLGTIPVLKQRLSHPEIPRVTVTGDPVVLTHKSAAGTGFVARVFSVPDPADKDFTAACIAASMYSSLLFNVVRTKYGACYTPSSFLVGTHADYGVDYLYRVSDLENCTAYTNEAQKLMENGKFISSVNEDGSYIYETIEDRLDGFKNSYINSLYSGQESTGGTAWFLSRNLLLYNNIATHEDARIKAVTAKDVKRVFKKYWIDGSSRWFAVVGQEEKNKIKF